MKAIGKLGPDYVLGCEGTDWSWYYQWGENSHGDQALLDEEGKEVHFVYYDLQADNWIIKSKKSIKKIWKHKKWGQYKEKNND